MCVEFGFEYIDSDGVERKGYSSDERLSVPGTSGAFVCDWEGARSLGDEDHVAWAIRVGYSVRYGMVTRSMSYIDSGG